MYKTILLPSKCAGNHPWLGMGSLPTNIYYLFMYLSWTVLSTTYRDQCSCFGTSIPLELPLPSFWFRDIFLPEEAEWDGQAGAKRFPSRVFTISDPIWMVWRKGTLLGCLIDIQEYKRHYFYQDPLSLCSLKFLTSKSPISPLCTQKPTVFTFSK